MPEHRRRAGRLRRAERGSGHRLPRRGGRRSSSSSAEPAPYPLAAVRPTPPTQAPLARNGPAARRPLRRGAPATVRARAPGDRARRPARPARRSAHPRPQRAQRPRRAGARLLRRARLRMGGGRGRRRRWLGRSAEAPFLARGGRGARRDARQLLGQADHRPRAAADRRAPSARPRAEQALLPLGALDLLGMRRGRARPGRPRHPARCSTRWRRRSASAAPTSACTTPATSWRAPCWQRSSAGSTRCPPARAANSLPILPRQAWSGPREPDGRRPEDSREVSRESRNRRHAQRGQVHPLQRADQRRRGGGGLPVHDDRAQRGDRRGARRAARRGRRDGRRHARSSTRRSRSTTSPAWSAAPTPARGWATASSPRSARPRRSATSSAPTPTPASPIPTGRSTRSPTPRWSRRS